MMISWVAVAPGSCTTSRLAAAATGWRSGAKPGDGDGDGDWWSAAAAFMRRRYDENFLAASAAKYVPPTLITKYRAHPLVCAAHVLPSALWSALAPLQLNPNLRRRRPRLHRLSGRVFVSTALLMSGGYALIHHRALHFHSNDFPSLAGGEALSLAVPGLWTWLGGGGWGGAGGNGAGGDRGTGDDDDAALSAFLIFEHSAAAWFAATAVMTLWSAWWGSRRSRCVSARGKGGVPRGREWVVAHRVWAVRHVAAGLSVATQRVVISLAHGACAAAAASSDAFDASFCSSPATQKGIFADSLVIGTAVCLITAEVAVRDLSAVSMAPEREKDGEKDGAPAGHSMTKKRD